MEKDFIEEDLKIVPGMGATMNVGSDAHAYYVSEVLPNGVVGLYQPHAFWDDSHPWEGGAQVVQQYNPQCKDRDFHQAAIWEMVGSQQQWQGCQAIHKQMVKAVIWQSMLIS